MSRHESDREDLLREATALVERIELTIAGFEEPIVCGFRRDGSASFYFGPDPVYQFNTAKQLRRAYVNGQLLKAERGSLIALSRERSQHEVALIRRKLTAAETATLLSQSSTFLNRLYQALQAGQAAIKGQVPPGADITSRVLAWLRDRPPITPIAAAPNVLSQPTAQEQAQIK